MIHPLQPIYNRQSKLLILGTMPSPVSRRVMFYYGHPQNRFWPVMAAICGETVPEGNESRKRFALRHGFALWDVLQSCMIRGAQDTTIRRPVANDFSEILQSSQISRIFTTGMQATRLYQKLCLPQTGLPSVYLPSTSAANRGSYPWQDLVNYYAKELQGLLR
ncbi:MAG: DNA-deoxyinosine glycosylase [Negativicutes bacterium]|nr:DNA-deoxyinosine glycosylase [Negativicutes bacterium]